MTNPPTPPADLQLLQGLLARLITVDGGTCEIQAGDAWRYRAALARLVEATQPREGSDNPGSVSPTPPAVVEAVERVVRCAPKNPLEPEWTVQTGDLMAVLAYYSAITNRAKDVAAITNKLGGLSYLADGFSEWLLTGDST